jgi:large subunit ribosomal protein L12
MEYIYAALLLHKLGKPINEHSMDSVLKAAGAEINESKVKSLIASLKGVDIDAEIANAVVSNASAPTAKPAEEAPKEEKREAAAEGLSALFG